ncbi:AIPR family protein [Nocardiopsis chromatogenes]|uniref:AIPR family protein n=1 Tax=Nocardiopsis chromatogenes TaxID=280239 RepID=UPI000686E8E5|nr:AIPR family protein [Nocardiopsis chromatogenes]
MSDTGRKQLRTTRQELHQIEEGLKWSYGGLIDESGLEQKTGRERERAWLSRAVAAAALRRETGLDREDCAKAVIDDYDDGGLDAVAVTDGAQVWLVQGKWSDKGNAGFSQSAALSLVHGLTLLEQRDFSSFNEKMQPFTAQLDSALADTRLKIHLVIALVGDEPLSKHARDVLDRSVEDHHGHGPMLDYKLLGAGALLEQLKDDRSPVPVNVNVRMQKWIKRDTPFTAFQGTVAAGDVAKWYDGYGHRLFSQNIRNSLGRTPINSGIQQTLADEPDNFWYFNNGITVLCDRVEEHWISRRRPDEPVELILSKVSVVNGAQTVTSIHEAWSLDPETVEDADVSVRVIALGDLGEERAIYAKRITQTTNTQNDVSLRDFIALDDTQARIREDFDLSLGKQYVYKRGEADPAPEAGCSVVHAAVALACAHRTSELSVRAKRSTDLLWESGRLGNYARLFGEAPSAFRIWRCVLIHREVGKALEQLHEHVRGRAADTTLRGDLFISHLIFRLLAPDMEDVDDPHFDVGPLLTRIPGLVKPVVDWLIYQIDMVYGPTSFLTSTFTNEERCKELANLVLTAVQAGQPVPEVPENYQPSAPRPRRPRRPNAVPTLVTAQLLAEGTPVQYFPLTAPEEKAVSEWLNADPRRKQASWTNDRSRPLVWAYDGSPYSASGLVSRIWELAGWEEAPGAVQGPARWIVEGRQSLYDMAMEWLTAQDEAEEE